MLANFFGKTNPANFIILFVLLLVFYAVNLFVISDGNLLKTDLLLWHGSIIGLFVLISFFFNFLLAKNKLTLYNSYGFLFFVLLYGIFPFSLIERQELLINLVLLIFLRRVYSLRTPKATLKKIFDSGFWLGILFILNPFTTIYGLLLYTSILFFQKVNFRTALIPIVGFIVPLVCFFTYCFWYDETEKFLNLFVWYTDYNFEFFTSLEVIIPLGFILLVTLMSIIIKTPKVFLISGNYRKFWSLTILNLLVALGLILLTKERTGAELMYVFFPVAIVLTNWIEGIQKVFFKDLILGLFVLAPIVLFII